ncbi:hypothetical protein MIR68_003726 [Amoeboaphelidium protococcarum]|nr:hypothetical protein MIR68_003726 [Amoeboaphelidium protococcarum]
MLAVLFPFYGPRIVLLLLAATGLLSMVPDTNHWMQTMKLAYSEFTSIVACFWAAFGGFDDRIPGVPTDQTSFINGMHELVYTTTRWREENGENLGEKKRVEFNEELQRSPMPHDPHSFRQINLISGNHLTQAVCMLPLTLLLLDILRLLTSGCFI